LTFPALTFSALTFSALARAALTFTRKRYARHGSGAAIKPAGISTCFITLTLSAAALSQNQTIKIFVSAT
jgi:hypothetical protein